MPPIDKLVRNNFWAVLLAPIAIAAFLDAQGVAQLIGIAVQPEEKDLAAAPPVRNGRLPSSSTERKTSAEPILSRNPFDHVTGPLHAPETAAEGPGGGPITLDTSDPYSAPTCDGVHVLVIAASNDENWSFAALAGSDGKSQLRRRGGEVGSKKVYFVGWDRVWLEGDGTLCQALLFDPNKSKNTPSAAPAPSASATPSRASRGGGKPLDPDIKKGIQKVGPTEYNIDRGVVDKILENQAELMKTARIAPEQENGRVVGIRLMNIKQDSLLQVLGMENGDRLQTINGFDMSSPEKALEAYARLRTADKLTVQVNRGGKNMNLDYNIK